MSKRSESKASKPQSAAKNDCANSASSTRHRLLEAFWNFAPAFQRWSDSQLAEKTTTPQRLRILGALHENGPQIMSKLRDELGVTATNITALVDALEKDGLVARRPHPKDRRATIIELTPKAECQLARGCAAYKDRVSEIFSCLAEDERRHLLKTMERLAGALKARGIL